MPPIDVRRVRWSAACRIVPTRYPAVSLFDRVADAADFDALYALEAMSNERARDELGEIERVPREQRLYASVPELLPRYVYSPAVETQIVPAKHGDASGVRGAAWLWPAA